MYRKSSNRSQTPNTSRASNTSVCPALHTVHSTYALSVLSLLGFLLDISLFRHRLGWISGCYLIAIKLILNNRANLCGAELLTCHSNIVTQH